MVEGIFEFIGRDTNPLSHEEVERRFGCEPSKSQQHLIRSVSLCHEILHRFAALSFKEFFYGGSCHFQR